MKKLVLVAVAAFAAAGACHATATDTQSLTIFAKSDPRYVDGKPSMCSIYFSTIFVDQSLDNRAFFAEGTFGITLPDNGRSISPFTKAVVAERIQQTEGYKAVPVAISSIVAGLLPSFLIAILRHILSIPKILNFNVRTISTGLSWKKVAFLTCIGT